MDKLKDKLVYLKNEEIDELISIGIISLDKLENLEGYFPFMMHYDEFTQHDLLRRIKKSLNHLSHEEKDESESNSVAQKPNREKTNLLSQASYSCSAKRQIPMNELVTVIYEYVNINKNKKFTDVYNHLRSHFKIRSFNRKNLRDLFYELNAIGEKDFILSFKIPSLINLSVNTTIDLETSYSKLLTLKAKLGNEYLSSFLQNADMIKEFFGDTHEYPYSAIMLDMSFMNKINSIIQSDSGYEVFKRAFVHYASYLTTSNLFSLIIEDNVLRHLIEYYPDTNEYLKKLMLSFSLRDVTKYIENEQFSELNEYLIWVYKTNVVQVNQSVYTLINTPSKSRNLNVFRERIAIGRKPKTLEEIGMEYEMSRERVRQIVAKFAKRIASTVKIISDDVLFHDEHRSISIKTIELIFPMYVNEILYAFMVNDKYMISKSGQELVLNSDVDKHSAPFLNNEYKTLTEYEFEEILARELNANQELELTNYYHTHLSKNYIRLGDSYIHRSIKNYKLLSFLVDEYFPDGIEVNNDEHLDHLFEYYVGLRGVNDFKDKGKRAITARLADQLDLIGKGTYTSRRNLGELGEVTKNAICLIAEDMLPKPVYYDYLYSRIQDHLIQKDKIKNHHHLHGLLKAFLPDNFIYHKDYFASRRVDSLWIEIENKLLDLDRVVTEEDIKTLSSSQSNTSYMNLISSNNWVYLGNKHFLPKKKIESDYEILESLERITLNLLNQHDVYHNSLIIPYLDQNLSKLKTDYSVNSTTAINSLLTYINQDKWKQQHNYIYKNELIIDNRFDVVKYLIREVDRISIREIYYRVNQIGDKVLNGQLLLEGLYPLYCRTSEDEMIKSENVYLSSHALTLIDSMIGALFLSRKGIILAKIKSYDKFPPLDYQWNEHLLASIIRLNLPNYRVIYSDKTYTQTSYLVVKSSSAIVKFEDYINLEELNE